MTVRVQQTSNDYGILVEPLSGPVTAWRGDFVLARSERARVMYETRLPPVVYFPREDVVAKLEPAPDFRTFCPFKGTASYAHVHVGEEVFEHGAWSYRNALPEGKAVDGYVAFMPGTVSGIEHQGDALGMPPAGNITGPTVDWLLREAWAKRTPEELTAALGRRLVEDGISVCRLTILIWSLHPMIAGRHFIWTRDSDEVTSFSPSYEVLDSPAFRESPLQHVADGLGGIRQKLDSNPDEFNFPILEDLRQQGVTDYVAMPLPFSGGRINVMTLACDDPDGFTTANLGLVFECSALISRLFRSLRPDLQRHVSVGNLSGQAHRRAGAWRGNPAGRRRCHRRGDRVLRFAQFDPAGSRARPGRLCRRTQPVLRDHHGRDQCP
ncbi:DUF427 domain-containing protein [Roseibium salinum]|nr:DUF427 domain-containing protein [Roseibium salinum]